MSIDSVRLERFPIPPYAALFVEHGWVFEIDFYGMCTLISYYVTHFALDEASVT